MRLLRPPSIAARAAACAAAALLISGCASSAVRPPTPAAQLRTEDLLQMPSPPGERYYLLLFGSETVIRRPSAVHTWATMVRVTEDSENGSGVIEPHTISWGPASHKTRPWNFTVEPGENGDLHGTIKEMYEFKEDITMWGPYEVWHGNYVRFLTQKAFMESGRVGYQCIDNVGEAARTGGGCDCIHSISDMDPMFDRKGYSLMYYGVPATRNIVKQIMTRPVIIDAPRTHDWLIPCLGLNCYPIQREFYSGEVVPFTPQAMQDALQQRAAGSSRTLFSIPWFTGS
jgi:hypothetical protein